MPYLRAHQAASGNLVLTRKFLEGAKAYAEHWPGRVTVAVMKASEPDTNLDHEEVVPGRWPFEVIERPDRLDRWGERMRQASLVLMTDSLFYEPVDTRDVRYVLTTENTFRTRCQMIFAENPSLLRSGWRLLKAIRRRLRVGAAVRGAAGIQCNGLPTYNVYGRRHANGLLYFDSRMTRADVIGEQRLEQRLETLTAGSPLRLIFSGRLTRIKGVDDLPLVAAELRRLDISFEMHVCGGGDRATSLAQQVRQLGLEDSVKLHGVLDFRRELLPMVRERSDLFICPHLQGDPSCTYLETLGGGVPIVGYANEAWAPLVGLSKGGWKTPLGKPQGLAQQVAELAERRQDIAAASRAARLFALQHTFEQTFRKRVDHLISCARLPQPSRAAAVATGSLS